MVLNDSDCESVSSSCSSDAATVAAVRAASAPSSASRSTKKKASQRKTAVSAAGGGGGGVSVSVSAGSGGRSVMAAAAGGSSSHEARALDLMLQAEKKLKPGFLGGLLGSQTQRYEEANELYVKAANMYKLAKNSNEAANAFGLAADCALKSEQKHEAATAFVNAAKVVQKDNPERSIGFYEQAVELFTDEGRFTVAAKHQKEIAELLEASGDVEQAIKAYETAADFYAGENAQTNENTCLLKVANMSATLERYDHAIDLFEKIARGSLDSNLLKWGAKDLFFRAVICHLANGDSVAARQAIDKYSDWDPSFGSTREAKFLDAVCKATDDFDTEAFTDAVVEFDSITKLDAWKTSLLLKVKKSIKKVEDDDGLA